MAKWTEAIATEELPAGERKCITLEKMPVTLFNLDGNILAIQNVCPHAQLPLGEGELSGTVLTCPFHGYAYDITNGENVDFPDDIPLQLYPTKVEDGKICVDLDPED